MSDEFMYLLHLTGCAVRGERPGAPRQPVDLEVLQRLAQEQGVFPSMALALSGVHTAGCHESFLREMRQRMKKAAIENCLWAERVFALLEEAEAEDLKLLMLKGFVVGEAYAYPETRRCVDTDLLVSRQEERRALAFFRAKGFAVTPRAAGHHHSICRHPIIGVVELHVDLFSERDKRTWFGGVALSDYISSNGQKVRVGDHSCHTLEATGHLLYLALHLVHHLVCTGASLGMFLDIGAFLTKNAKTISMGTLAEAISRCGCDRAFSAILKICDEYCGFNTRSMYPALSEELSGAQILLLLDDLESGGGMGMKNLAVRGVCRVENAREKLVSTDRSMLYGLYRGVEYIQKFRKYFFPTLEEAALVYPDVKTKYGIGWMRAKARYTRKELSGYTKRKKGSAAIRRDVASYDRTPLLRALGLL